MSKARGKCWLWTRGTTGEGYGAIRMGDSPQTPQRLAWALFRGDFNARAMIGNTCGNRLCFRPSHLRLEPSNTPGRKLTYEQAMAIRAERAAGRKLKAIAEKYGVAENTAWRIARGGVWCQKRFKRVRWPRGKARIL